MKKSTKELFDFIRKSPTCFHVVENLREQLLQHSFIELKEKELWNIKRGGKYFVVRNSSSIISFTIPENEYKGFFITASHSDSPCFKIKESPEMEGAGLCKLNVEKYGGMLLNPWFDRPLSIAGRIAYVDDNNKKICTKLINIDKDLLVIPNLAIHMKRDANDGHKIDIQNEIVPVVSSNKTFDFMNLLDKYCDLGGNKILGHDLYLYNRDEPKLWGEKEEFILSPRLDDLECVYTTFCGFIESNNNEKVLLHCVFDNEEVGSQSKQGAGSTFITDVLKRLNFCLGRSEESFYTAVANSFVVSADNAHAVHPNYANFADPVNKPVVNGGPVIKYNASQKYTTDGVSAAFFKKICETAKVPYQIFTNNSNIAGGSTLGNILTSQISIASVDIGLAQWAMHSPNESAGVEDIEYMIKAVKEFYNSTLDS